MEFQGLPTLSSVGQDIYPPQPHDYPIVEPLSIIDDRSYDLLPEDFQEILDHLPSQEELPNVEMPALSNNTRLSTINTKFILPQTTESFVFPPSISGKTF